MFRQCLENKHSISVLSYPNFYQILGTKVGFYHADNTNYYGVYYGNPNKEQINIKDVGLEHLACSVYCWVKDTIAAEKRREDCKKMEKLLRS